jgi:transcriptional regulator with XRE-family HTH domain
VKNPSEDHEIGVAADATSRGRDQAAAVMPAATPDRDARIAFALERTRQGKSLEETATELGVNKSTICRWLLGKMPEAYEAARHEGITAKLNDVADLIEIAPSHLHVARLRETLRFWQWVAERRLREFAPKAELSGPNGGPIEILDHLERARRLAFLNAQAEREPPPIDAELVEDDPQDSEQGGSDASSP